MASRKARPGRKNTQRKPADTRYVRRTQTQLKSKIRNDKNRYRVGATSSPKVSDRIKAYGRVARGKTVYYASVRGSLKKAEQKLLNTCRGGCPYNQQMKSNIPRKTKGGNLYAIDKKK